MLILRLSEPDLRCYLQKVEYQDVAHVFKRGLYFLGLLRSTAA